MGVFDLLKKVFIPEPESAEEIDFQEIHGWFDEKYSARKDFLKGQIQAIKSKIDEEKNLADQNIKQLQNAELRNPNIPEKAKHYMEGNRKTYIQKVSQFMDSIEIPEDHIQADEFIKEFKRDIEEFGRSTARTYAILREFFEEESSKLALNIKNIDLNADEIKEAVKNSRLEELDSLKQEINRIKNKISHKDFIKSEISKKKNLSEELAKKKEKSKQKISDLENSKEYKDYQMLKHRFDEKNKQSDEKESEIRNSFSSLERPMKKYARIIFNDKDILQKYSDDPVSAFAQDFNLKILNILQNMRKAITEDKLELKDKQKIKALEDIKKLDKETLNKFMTEYAQLKKKQNEYNSQMKKITVIQNIAEEKEKLKIASSMLEKAKKDIINLDSELQKIDIRKMKESLKNKIKESLNINANIS